MSSASPLPGSTTPGSPTSRRRRPVLTAHLVLTAFGAVFFLGSFAYPWVNPQDGTIGAGVLPRVAGLLLLLIGLGLVRQELRGGSVLDGDGHVEEAISHSAEERPVIRRKLVVVTTAMVVTALLVPVLGMLPTLALLTLFLTAFVERMRWSAALTTSAGVLVVSYVLFILVLRVPLPFGLLDPAVWSTL